MYRGAAIPSLRGFYVFADFSGRVWAKHGPGARRYALPGADGQLGQISSFGEDASGELYVVSLARVGLQDRRSLTGRRRTLRPRRRAAGSAPASLQEPARVVVRRRARRGSS